MDYRILGKLYIPIYVFCNILLVAVLIFGTGDESWGARSWLSIGGFRFQPSEIVKIGLIISISKFIDNNKNDINNLWTLLKILLFAGVPIFLIYKQPDLGTALVFVFFIIIMLFIAGLNIKYFVYTIIAGVISLPILWFSLKRYQKNRILNLRLNGENSKKRKFLNLLLKHLMKIKNNSAILWYRSFEINKFRIIAKIYCKIYKE
jgi:rod shape determining protein RodA